MVDPAVTTIQDKLDARVRPMLQTHGGDVTLTAVRDGLVTLRFAGACVGCPLRPVTLAVTIEPALRTVEGVRGVVAEGVRLPASVNHRIAATLAPPNALGGSSASSSEDAALSQSHGGWS